MYMSRTSDTTCLRWLTGLLAAAQAVVPQMKGQPDAAILVTGGGLSFDTDEAAQFAVAYKAVVLAVAKSAQRKLISILHFSLKPQGVYVGEVTVSGMVKGTIWDGGDADAIEADDVASDFWKLYTDRDRTFVLRT